MPTDILQIPPIRTTLLDPSGGNTTAKEWYYYWNQAGDKLNGIVTEGAHADRPNAGDMPDGALYVESERSVLYANEGGTWHYIAGTMWGTLNPDQRPTDLGPNDAGFEFRSIDASDTYAPRTFVWSGAEWIETTLVEYGLHANRPPAGPQTPPRTIYVETDRSGVIYQQQANAWHFLAGAMWGTLLPDQRPTDLGANDAGFTFRTTVAPARSFVWSGTAWIETTPLLDPTTATGDLIARSPTGITRVPIGPNGDVLTASGGMPVWAQPAAGATGQVQWNNAGVFGASPNLFWNNTNSSLGIGTSNPGATLQVTRNVAGGYGLEVSSTSPANTYGIGIESGTGYLILDDVTNPARRMAVTPAGVRIGSNAYSAQAGDLGVSRDPSPTNGVIYFGNSTSAYIWYNGTSWGFSPALPSDIRLKRNVTDLVGGLPVVNQLRPIAAEWNGLGGHKSGERVVSLIAQELQKVLPGTIVRYHARLRTSVDGEWGEEETELLSYEPTEILMHLILAVQQISAALWPRRT
jgi:hypothetical protein